MDPCKFCSKQRLRVGKKHLTLSGVKSEDPELYSEFNVAMELLHHALFSREFKVVTVSDHEINYSYGYTMNNLLLVLVDAHQCQVYETQVCISGRPEKMASLVECLYWLNLPDNRFGLDQTQCNEKKQLLVNQNLFLEKKYGGQPSWALLFIACFLSKCQQPIQATGLQSALQAYGLELPNNKDCARLLCRLRQVIKYWFFNPNLSFDQAQENCLS